MTAHQRAVVVVSPRAELERRRVLFATLEQIFPISFVGSDDPGDRRVDGVVTFGVDSPPSDGAVPRLEFGARNHARPGRVVFGGGDSVPRPFRGRELSESGASTESLAVGPADAVLAAFEERAVWTANAAGGGSWRAALAPEELSAGSRLRDRFGPGNFLGLLPLLELTRAATARAAWALPSAQACFVLDDPNLSRPCYGYVRYRELAADAERDDYHVAMALIPLDARFARAAACEIFREESRRLSLLIHGNDHVRWELGRDLGDRAYNSVAAQALRRISAFERRWGLDVARVMAPPHGACSEEALKALDRLGFDGVCSTNAYGWIARSRGTEVAGFEAGGFATGCLGALPRVHVNEAGDDLVFRRYLGQPLILYGHHGDLAGGTDVLGELARRINDLGPTEWCGLDRIVERRFEMRVERALLRVRPLGRRVRVDVPAGISELEVEVHPSLSPRDCEAVVFADGARTPTRVRLESGRASFDPQGAGSVSVHLESSHAIDPALVSTGSARLWPTVRRLMTYTRDQVAPLVEPSRFRR